MGWEEHLLAPSSGAYTWGCRVEPQKACSLSPEQSHTRGLWLLLQIGHGDPPQRVLRQGLAKFWVLSLIPTLGWVQTGSRREGGPHSSPRLMPSSRLVVDLPTVTILSRAD